MESDLTQRTGALDKRRPGSPGLCRDGVDYVSEAVCSLTWSAGHGQGEDKRAIRPWCFLEWSMVWGF